jgi:hypothetical protein
VNLVNCFGDEPHGYNYAAFLRARQRETSPMMWAALYQQRPAPEEGDYFKSAWLKPYETLPPRETLRVYGGSDYAVTADGGDYTVHLVVGLDPEGRMYLFDRWRKQVNAPWYAEFKSELLSFPAGKNDDQVDALGLIGQLLDQMVPGQAPMPPEPPKIDTGYRPYRPPARLDDWLLY